MKPFRFRLQAVLRLREQAEQAAQQQCARAYVVLQNATARFAAAKEASMAFDDFRRQKLAAGIAAKELEHLRDYGQVLEGRRIRLARELVEAQTIAEEARQQLLVASRRRESLERLRTRQKRAHNYQAERAEQKLLDEVAGRAPTLLEAWGDAAEGFAL